MPGGPVGSAIRASTNEWMIILCLLLIVAVAARDLSGGRSLLRSRTLVKLGEWSYAFYLVHATVIYAVLALLGGRPPSWSNLLWYAALLGVSIPVAAALHYGVEKPMERKLRAGWDRRRARRDSVAALSSARDGSTVLGTSDSGAPGASRPDANTSDSPRT